MTDSPESPPAEPPSEAEPKKKKGRNFLDKNGKFRPRPAMKAAVLEIAQRKRAGIKPEFRIVAEKHHVNEASLKKISQMYARGQVEMSGQSADVETRKLTLAAETERSSQLLVKYESMLNDSFEGLLKRAKQDIKDENYLAFDQLGIPKVIQQLKECRSLRNLVEKGNFAALEQLMELASRREQAAAAAVPTQINFTTNTVNMAPPAPVLSSVGAAAQLTSTQHHMKDILLDAKILEVKPAEETPHESH